MNVLKIYNDTYWELLNLNDKIYDLQGKKIIRLKNFHTSEEEKERISLSRTRRRIKEICLCNDFEYFVTMTVSSKIKEFNRFDLEDCVDHIKKIMKKIKRNSFDFKYIYIIEQHKNGAYHFHGMMKNLPKNDIYINENGYLSSHYLDELGFNSFSKIKEYNKCCSYISKYITKNCCRTENNQVYFCSRGLKKPDEELMLTHDLNKIFQGGEVFQNEYCQIKGFDITRLNSETAKRLNFYFKDNDEFFQKNNNYNTNLLNLLTNKKIKFNIK